MHLSINSLAKIASITFLCLTLAACQSTGLKPGSIATSFAPAGWASQTKGNTTVYVCLPSTCKQPEMVVIGPMKVSGNVEEAIRENVLSAELMNAIDNVVNVAAKGKIKFSTDRRIVTKTYSGFDLSSRIRTRDGYDYGAARVIIQNNRGTMVASFAKSQSRAKSNLKRFLQQTTIHRLP